jgi:asparagine synthase (glutamine-hydrolysing)
MRRLFADLLPDDILRPHGKAEFGFAFWGEDARRFAAGWNGEGVDPELVDADALRATWAEPNPPIAAATLLQGAWLASRSAGAAAPAPPAGSPAPEAGTA